MLMSDAAGLPGSMIETITLNDPVGITTATSAVFPALVTGTTYWIAAQYVPGGDVGSWFINDQGLSGPGAYTANSVPSWIPFNNSLAAFRVNGDSIAAVPSQAA